MAEPRQVPHERMEPSEDYDSEWSERVESLEGEGRVEEAESLLHSVIRAMEGRDSADVNLELAAALSDLAGIYMRQDLSLKADPLYARALLIRRRSETRRYEPSLGRNSLQRLPNLESLSISEAEAANADRALPHQPTSAFGSESGPSGPAASGNGSESEQDSWEENDLKLPLPSIIRPPSDQAPPSTQPAADKWGHVKQRGRGAFRFGSDAMYSDQRQEGLGGSDTWTSKQAKSRHQVQDFGSRETLDRLEPLEAQARQSERPELDAWDQEGEDRWRTPSGTVSPIHEEFVPLRTDHVLEIYGFPPSVKTRHLEALLAPFQSTGVAVRWVDDTRALAVFHTPAVAEKALRALSQPPFLIRRYDGSAASLINARDLAPPVIRPATSARVANRMIASALRDQGAASSLRERGKATATEDKHAQVARRERLAVRGKMRSEAWGGEETS